MKSGKVPSLKRGTLQRLIDDRMIPSVQTGGLESLPDGYLAYLSEIKDRVVAARQRIVAAAN
jgi:hypothetical protein